MVVNLNYFVRKINDSKSIFVERRFDIIVISFSSSNGKCLQCKLEIIYIYIYKIGAVTKYDWYVTKQVENKYSEKLS